MIQRLLICGATFLLLLPLCANSLNSTLSVVVEKTVYKYSRRVVFLAGLEGTGHHNWKLFFDYCSELFSEKCKNLTEANDALFTINYNGNDFGIWSSESPDLAATRDLRAKRAVRAFSNASQTASDVFVIGLDNCIWCGMMSYPNHAYADKTLDHPNIYQLASYAEEGGVDLRVVVLMRSARGILESTVKRGFGRLSSDSPYFDELPPWQRIHGFSKQPLILLANAESLYTQLSLLDPAFYFCIQHDDFGSTVDLTNSGSGKNRRFRRENMFSPMGEELFSFLHPYVFSTRVVDRIGQALRKLEQPARVNEVNVTHGILQKWLDIFEPMLASRLSLIQELCDESARLRRKNPKVFY